MEHVVYMYTCCTTKKSYIGQTKDLKERHRQHSYPYSGCIAFRNAIQKHGFNNFDLTILAKHLSLEEANTLEEKLIFEHDTIVPNGYNIRSGGLNKYNHSETKRKISNKLKGRKCSKETIEKRRQKTKGRKRDPELVKQHAIKITGKKRTLEQRKRMSEAQKARKHKWSDEHKQMLSKKAINRETLTFTCEHCGKVGKSNAMFRWHFDNCRNKRGEYL